MIPRSPPPPPRPPGGIVEYWAAGRTPPAEGAIEEILTPPTDGRVVRAVHAFARAVENVRETVWAWYTSTGLGQWFLARSWDRYMRVTWDLERREAFANLALFETDPEFAISIGISPTFVDRDSGEVVTRLWWEIHPEDRSQGRIVLTFADDERKGPWELAEDPTVFPPALWSPAPLQDLWE